MDKETNNRTEKKRDRKVKGGSFTGKESDLKNKKETEEDKDINKLRKGKMVMRERNR